MIAQLIKRLGIKVARALCLCLLFSAAVSAQTTSFTYQGKLTDSSIAANGTYQMQFALFDGSNAQIGSTITNSSVQVANGIFTVTLDFGAGAFPGANRFLQIAVFSSTTSAYVTLAPKQPMTSAPYSVRSLNAATADTATNSLQLGGIAANQYVQSTDPRMSDDRNPLPGSGNYIQNSSSQQAAANFNIAGNGSASFLSAVNTVSANQINSLTHYYIGSNRVFSVAGTSNLFAGLNSGTGASNTGSGNAFAGADTGAANTTGSFNAFFGSNAGAVNTTGINNAFLGQAAGFKNTTGHDNTFLGNGAGLNNATASGNTFVGSLAGQATTGGINNTFLGINSGVANVGSNNNTFVGANSANTNLTGNGNTYIGANTDGVFLATNATAIGQNAFAGQSNSLILGGINGLNGSLADTAVGIGTSTPQTALNIFQSGAVPTGSTYPLLVESNTFSVGMQFHSRYSAAGHTWSITTDGNGNGSGEFFLKDSAFPTNSLSLTSAGSGNSSLFIDGTIALSLLTGGQQAVCINSGTVGILSTCSSSLRYKKDIEPFASGMNLLNKLQPITFRWKSNDAADLGFGAEDVAKVEPLLVTHNAKGEVEGVKYDRITAVLVNAIKEQQAQIEALQKKVSEQQKAFDNLKKIVSIRRHKAPNRK
jgi:hypothetical protein